MELSKEFALEMVIVLYFSHLNPAEVRKNVSVEAIEFDGTDFHIHLKEFGHWISDRRIELIDALAFIWSETRKQA